MDDVKPTIDLTKYGYAPGGYIQKCKQCSIEFIGDKRCSRCIDCATKAYKEDELKPEVQAKKTKKRSKTEIKMINKFSDALQIIVDEIDSGQYTLRDIRYNIDEFRKYLKNIE